jgi:hypothetical protein
MTTFDCEKINNHPQLDSRMQNTMKKLIFQNVVSKIGIVIEDLTKTVGNFDSSEIKRNILESL